ncbi:MAG: 2-hydroxyacid dehydrogenase [Cytophagales bacterium]|nr:MAG: 2-hydroxyacid dehydrogenase [Cytophagales bacterium]
MKVAVFSAKPYDKEFLLKENNIENNIQFSFFEPHLSGDSIKLAEGHEGICVFVNDDLNRQIVEQLSSIGIKIIALRCAGFNNVDIKACNEHGIVVVRVPSYSPNAVAEHTVGLILTLNRKIHRAYNRVKENNFALDGLMGFDIYQKTIGIIGIGKIGKITAKILLGFGAKILYYDLHQDSECDSLGMRYSSLEEIYVQSNIISLHCPLTPSTKHIINEQAIDSMKQGVMLVNTSRGALIDTKAVIKGLKSLKIGYLALDVYEEEADLFFEDLSAKMINDEVFLRLLTFPNVLVTGHQAFFTQEALSQIAKTTIKNLSDFQSNKVLENKV